MYQIIITALGLYIFSELLCHGFAFFVRKIFQNANKDQINSEEHLKFVQSMFYRTMLLLTIALMSHFYTEIAFFEQNDVIRFIWSVIIILLILFTLWWLNALIIFQIISQKSQTQSITHVFKQKISYIMLHPMEFKHLYISKDYLKKSLWLNRFLSVIALIFAFVDTHLFFNS